MKNLIILLTCFLSSTSNFFYCRNDSLYKVELKCKLTIPENDPGKTYNVALIYDNIVIETGIYMDEESFLLRLKENTQYTLRIVKEDYVPMVITLDTRIKDNNNIYDFDNSFFQHLYGFTLSLSLDKPSDYLASK